MLTTIIILLILSGISNIPNALANLKISIKGKAVLLLAMVPP